MANKPYSRFPVSGDPAWLVSAFEEIGITEIAGAAHNPRIKEYHACTGLGATDDETPWCSSFVCFIMQSCDIVSTRSAASLSWLRWGKELDKPVRGCVVVFERVGPDGRVVPNLGHVGFWLGESAASGVTYVLGGNQSNQVGINAYESDRILSYRWPALPHNSTTNIASGTAAIGSATAAAPAVMSIVDGLKDSESKVTHVVGTAQKLSSGLGIPVSSAIAVIGLAVALAGMIYVIRERNKKIKAFGI